jgi:predicted DNA-binding WGR domain protein
MPFQLKSRLLLVTLLLLFCGCFSSLLLAVEKNTLHVFTSASGLKGYKDEHDKIVIKPQFDEVWSFDKNGLAGVKLNGKWGYINTSGKLVIEPQFDKTWGFFHSGLAVVKLKGKYGFINVTGKFVIEPQFDEAEMAYHELELIKVKRNGKYGYINALGKFIFEPQFDEAQNFPDHDLAAVKLNGKWGFINRLGQFVIKPQFDEVQNFHNGLAEVKLNDKWGYINASGQFVIKPQFDAVQDFDNGLAGVKLNDKWGYINASGQFVIKPQFDEVRNFYSGLAGAKLNNKWGYINASGQFVIKPQFDYVDVFGAEDLARVEFNDKAGYINKLGEVVKITVKLDSTCIYFDNFTENGDDTVTDPRNGLIWQKCAVGQTWNGSGCTGEAQEMPWWDVMRAAKKNNALSQSDWRLPTKDELTTVMIKKMYEDRTKFGSHRVVSSALAYPTNPKYYGDYLGTFWFSSGLTAHFDGSHWKPPRYDGIDNSLRQLNHAVRLVRGGQPVGALEFKTEQMKVLPYEFHYHFYRALVKLIVICLLPVIAYLYFIIFIRKAPFGLRLIGDVFYRLVFGFFVLFFIGNFYALGVSTLSADKYLEIWDTPYNAWLEFYISVDWHELHDDLKSIFFVIDVVIVFFLLFFALLRYLIKKIKPDFGEKAEIKRENKARSDLLESINALNSYLKPEEQLSFGQIGATKNSVPLIYCGLGAKDLAPRWLSWLIIIGNYIGMKKLYLLSEPYIHAWINGHVGEFGEMFLFQEFFLPVILIILFFKYINLISFRFITKKTYLLGWTNSRFFVLQVKTLFRDVVDYNHKISFTEYPLDSVSVSNVSNEKGTTIKIHDLEKPFEIQLPVILDVKTCGLKYDG